MNDTTERKAVVMTGDIPQCPHCEKPTRRTGGGMSRTLMYFAPIYDEQGRNTNPDRNTETTNWHCYECEKDYVTVGNHTDGYHYRP